MSNPVVTITMENGDVMKAELYPDKAPNTVNNFISLVSRGFYDGLIFHRVISGFMIQKGHIQIKTNHSEAPSVKRPCFYVVYTARIPYFGGDGKKCSRGMHFSEF